MEDSIMGCNQAKKFNFSARRSLSSHVTAKNSIGEEKAGGNKVGARGAKGTVNQVWRGECRRAIIQLMRLSTSYIASFVTASECGVNWITILGKWNREYSAGSLAFRSCASGCESERFSNVHVSISRFEWLWISSILLSSWLGYVMENQMCGSSGVEIDTT